MLISDPLVSAVLDFEAVSDSASRLIVFSIESIAPSKSASTHHSTNSVEAFSRSSTS